MAAPVKKCKASYPMSDLPRANVLGIGISAITMRQALDQVATWIKWGAREYVCVCNVYTVMECQRDSAVRSAVNRAGLATPDGMPLVWLSRWKSRTPVSRVYGPDLMLALCEQSIEQGYSHYFYGGAQGVPELLAERLQQRFPGLHVAGTCSPPFRALTAEEDAHIVTQLNQAAPDIIWVGLGTPKQDLWMAAHRSQLNAPVLIAVGAAFDFHAGKISQAPKWMQSAGLEWLFRLIQEPRRLWYRYLVYNPLFVVLVLAQSLRIRHYAVD
jgi:N-acetylglucosaminyldiphosphoundecaprenol N-acetyl-beta-D-mannosaminyltransferase